MAYHHLAVIYDRLMEETPYEQWLAWLKEYWAKHGEPKSIIDLGCGTGSLAIPLAKQGFKVTGVDLSAEMLAIAYEKMRRSQVDVTWARHA